MAEAGVKPECTIVLSEIVEPVKKIATVLPISDEMLEDAPSIQSYINSRLSLFVAIEEERQLLRGTGTNELVGLFNRSGNQAINTTTRAGADDNVTAIAKAIANTARLGQRAARRDRFAPVQLAIHPTVACGHGRRLPRRRPAHQRRRRAVRPGAVGPARGAVNGRAQAPR